MLATIESKNQAVSKLEALIERGRSRAANVIDHVMRNQPTDRLARGEALQFRAADNLPEILMTVPDREQATIEQSLHRNAIYQMAQATDMPVKFIDSLQSVADPWGRELLAHNLQTVFNRRFQKKHYLLRSLQQEVRGFLSDSYRRIDSRPIVEAFATAVQEKGALPYEGYVTDTKIAIQAIMPEVYEPVPGEVVAFGLSLENSDFGNGALSLRAYLLRIWCTNLAITQEQMRQVHLGKRLDESMVYSQQTYELDAQTTVSALRDVIQKQLDAGQLQQQMDLIRQANGKTVDSTQARELLRKALQKNEADSVIEVYNSLDTVNMPSGNTMWRLSNAVSWVAGKTEDAERKLEISKAAASRRGLAANARQLRAEVGAGDLVGVQPHMPLAMRDEAQALLRHFSNDNTSPETTSFHVTFAKGAEAVGQQVARESARRFLFTSLLMSRANHQFGLLESGQRAMVYHAPHPPVRQMELSSCISDSFYRELFMSPCLSGWDDGEVKCDYMHLCHQVLSRSQLNAVAKLREAGIITNDLIVLPSLSNVSLANNGIHITMGSKVLTRALGDTRSRFSLRDEKRMGDLAIKIYEHFLSLFVGTYSAAPYRIDFAQFHPEKLLSFLPHELDFTHLRLMWREWKEKANLRALGRTVTPYGPQHLDGFVARLFRLRGLCS